MRQSACLVINKITVDNFAALFNCKPVDWAFITARSKTVVLLWFSVAFFWCQSFGDVSLYVFLYYFKFGFGC